MSSPTDRARRRRPRVRPGRKEPPDAAGATRTTAGAEVLRDIASR